MKSIVHYFSRKNFFFKGFKLKSLQKIQKKSFEKGVFWSLSS